MLHNVRPFSSVGHGKSHELPYLAAEEAQTLISDGSMEKKWCSDKNFRNCCNT